MRAFSISGRLSRDIRMPYGSTRMIPTKLTNSLSRPPPSNRFLDSLLQNRGRGHFRLSSLRNASLLNYLLMSSFASRRFSNGCRNGFVASGAVLIACVISLAAVGKVPRVRGNPRERQMADPVIRVLLRNLGIELETRASRSPIACRPRA